MAELIEDGVYFSDVDIEQVFFMAESILMIFVHKQQIQSRTGTFNSLKSTSWQDSSDKIDDKIGLLEIKLLLVDKFKHGTIEDIAYVKKYKERISERPEFKKDVVELQKRCELETGV